MSTVRGRSSATTAPACTLVEGRLHPPFDACLYTSSHFPPHPVTPVHTGGGGVTQCCRAQYDSTYSGIPGADGFIGGGEERLKTQTQIVRPTSCYTGERDCCCYCKSRARNASNNSSRCGDHLYKEKKSTMSQSVSRTIASFSLRATQQ